MCQNVILETLMLESSDQLDIDWPLNRNSLHQSNKILDKICVLHAKMIPSIITKYNGFRVNSGLAMLGILCLLFYRT